MMKKVLIFCGVAAACLIVGTVLGQNPTMGDTNRLCSTIAGKIGLYTNGATVGQVPTYSGFGVSWGSSSGTGNVKTNASQIYNVGTTQNFDVITWRQVMSTNGFKAMDFSGSVGNIKFFNNAGGLAYDLANSALFDNGVSRISWNGSITFQTDTLINGLVTVTNFINMSGTRATNAAPGVGNLDYVTVSQLNSTNAAGLTGVAYLATNQTFTATNTFSKDLIVLGKAAFGTNAVSATHNVSILGGLRVQGTNASGGSSPLLITGIPSTNGMVHIVADAGTSNFIAFSESGVAARGALGFFAGNPNMFFRVGGTMGGGTNRLEIANNGDVNFFNAAGTSTNTTLYGTGGLTMFNGTFTNLISSGASGGSYFQGAVTGLVKVASSGALQVYDMMAVSNAFTSVGSQTAFPFYLHSATTNYVGVFPNGTIAFGRFEAGGSSATNTTISATGVITVADASRSTLIGFSNILFQGTGQHFIRASSTGNTKLVIQPESGGGASVVLTGGAATQKFSTSDSGLLFGGVDSTNKFINGFTRTNFTIDVPVSITAGTAYSTNFALVGCSNGIPVAIGSTLLEDGIDTRAYCTNNGTVTIRFRNANTVTAVDPTSQTVTVQQWIP